MLLKVNLRGIGISLVDFHPLELMYISIDQIKYEATVKKVYQDQNIHYKYL